MSEAVRSTLGNPGLNCGCGQTPCKTYGTRSNPSTDVPRGYREAAGCIVQRASDGKVLLLRRSILETSMHGMYELPGGKLEEGETPSQAALIETKEEAGLDVKIVQRLPSHVDDDMRKVYHGFLAVPKKNAKVVISEEHDEYKWMTIEEALKLPNRKLSHTHVSCSIRCKVLALVLCRTLFLSLARRTGARNRRRTS